MKIAVGRWRNVRRCPCRAITRPAPPVHALNSVSLVTRRGTGPPPRAPRGCAWAAPTAAPRGRWPRFRPPGTWGLPHSLERLSFCNVPQFLKNSVQLTRLPCTVRWTRGHNAFCDIFVTQEGSSGTTALCFAVTASVRALRGEAGSGAAPPRPGEPQNFLTHDFLELSFFRLTS